MAVMGVPPAAAPPGGAAGVPPTGVPPSSVPPPRKISLTVLAARLLMLVGRWRRRRAHHDLTAFANAGPPHKLTRSQLELAVPPNPPVEADALRQRSGYPRHLDIPPELDRAWLWTLALHEQTWKVARRMKGVKSRTYGFVQAKDGVQLAAIFYVGYLALTQAAPLFVTVGERRFPVVIRPRFRDLPWRSHLRFDRGEVTCRGRLGTKVGVLSAAHVVSPTGDKFSVHAEDRVTCPGTGSPSACLHQILAADAIMDAALVEDGVPSPSDQVVRAMPVPGYFPLQIRSPIGPVPARVIEMAVSQGVVPGQLGAVPGSPALLLSDVPGEPGWSGSMVFETTYRDYFGSNSPPTPYCMFLGARNMYTGPLGKLHMLRQHEIVWGLELLKDA
jgi:hypothetical protein